jgi:tetratricopeptide (TPR) repeat protein
MYTRSITLLLAACLLLAVLLAGCSSRDEYVAARIEEARGYAAVRDYDRAQQVLDVAIERAGDEYELLHEKADIYTRAHAFQEAAEWFGRAAQVDPSSWKAVVGKWEAELQQSAESDDGKALVLAEALEILEEAPDGAFNLSAAVAAYEMAGEGDGEEEDAEAEAAAGEGALDTSLFEDAKTRLVELYPDSELGSDLIKEECDWVAVERDDATRLEMADEFLAAHPVSEWRTKVLGYKMVTLKRLEQFDELERFGNEVVASHPDDPEILDLVARSYVSCRLLPDEAAALARRATELGGDEDDLPTYSLTAARALVQAEDFASARDLAVRSLELLDIGPDEEETGSAHHFTLGQALEGLGHFDEAFDAYLRSIVVGGRKNRWPARADTALAELFDRAFARKAGRLTLHEFARARTRYDGPVYTDVTSQAGLGDRRESRVAWGDYDGDGYDDLLLAGRVLMRNQGDGTFADATAEAGIGESGTNGAVWADIDNDGDLDFYATSGATEGERTDRLWVNRGDGTFEDATEAAGGITDLYTTEGAAWGDIDADGFVDLYLASYERPTHGDWSKLGQGFPDILYRNLGDGTFAEVTYSAGISPPFGEDLSGRGVNWGDFDNDGDLDIFVSNYRLQEDFLWMNEGDGTFTNVAPELGVSGTETDGWWGHTIGSEWGDYDSDGDLDLICANLAHPRYIEVSDMSMLYENTLRDPGGLPGAPGSPGVRPAADGARPFVERRADAGIKFAETHSDPAWGDVDADGDLDLFITSIYPDCGTFLYLNDGRGTFVDATWHAGVRTFNGWGCAMSDYDLDGDLDIAVASGEGLRLFRNDGPAQKGVEGHWLAVKAVGTQSNASGIGARIIVTRGKNEQIREVQGGKGTTSQHSLTTFFGLGDWGRPVDVEVRFLGGETVRLDDVEADRLLVVVEPGRE